MSEQFPDKHWFKNTPENVAEFIRRFPDTPVVGLPKDLRAWFDKWKTVGSFGFDNYGLNADGREDFFVTCRSGYTEFVFEHQKAKKFPVGYYFKATPENLTKFFEQFPNQRWSSGEFLTKESVRSEYSYLGNRQGRFTWDPKPYSELKEYVFDEPKIEELREFPEGYYFENTPENLKKLAERFPDTKWQGGSSVKEKLLYIGKRIGRHVGQALTHSGIYDDCKLFSFDEESKPEEFPEKMYIKVTPQNLEEFKRRYGHVKWVHGETVAQWMPGYHPAYIGAGTKPPLLNADSNDEWYVSNGYKPFDLPGQQGAVARAVITDGTKEPMPKDCWFRNTPENVAEFARRWPDAKWASGDPFLELMDREPYKSCSFLGCCSDGRVILEHEGSLELHKELTLVAKPEEATVAAKPEAKKFPDKRWFKITPENVKAFLRDFPDMKMWDGVTASAFLTNPLYKGFYVYSNHDNDRLYFNGSAVPAWVGEEYVFDKKLQLREGAWYERADGQVVGPCKPSTDPGRKWIVHGFWYRDDGTNLVNSLALKKEVPEPRTKTGLPGRMEWGDSPIVAAYLKANAPINSGEFVTWIPNSVSVSKEKEVLQHEKNEIAELVVAKLKGTDTLPETTGPGLLSRAGGFAWKATKSTLGYTFAPAKPWIQNIVFVAAMAMLGYLGYKGYNFAQGIQLPSITWEEPAPKGLPQAPSPSDHPFN